MASGNRHSLTPFDTNYRNEPDTYHRPTDLCPAERLPGRSRHLAGQPPQAPQRHAGRHAALDRPVVRKIQRRTAGERHPAPGKSRLAGRPTGTAPQNRQTHPRSRRAPQKLQPQNPEKNR